MQTRLARSWSALRYDLSSQRALDNAPEIQASTIACGRDRRAWPAPSTPSSPEPPSTLEPSAQRSA